MINYQPGDKVLDIDGHVGVVSAATDTHVDYTVGRAKFSYTREHVLPFPSTFYFDAEPAPAVTLSPPDL